MATGATVDPRERYAGWVAPLCWMAVALEGFDLVVLGVVLPALLNEPGWGLTPNTASLVSVIGLVGVMIGALTVGTISDYIGRRQTMLWTVISFSILTLLCAFAPNPWIFGLLRFLAGLGLGGVLPTALALVNEYATRGRGGAATTNMMTGYHVGAVLTALLGIIIIEPLGWHWMFIVGALPALVLVPVMWRYLPESAAFLRVRAGLADRSAAGTAPARANPISTLFHHGLGRSTIAFWVTSFMGLLLVYGLNTWLPQIMRAADYDLGNSLGFLVVLNAGAVIGLLVAGRVGDAITPRNAAIIWFLASAVLLAALAIKLPLLGIYVMIFITGCFVFSAQNLVYAFAATNYPPKVRGTALGMAAGVGRLGAISGPIMGGTLVTAGIAYPWGFFGFAVAGALGGLAVTAMRTMRRAQGDGSIGTDGDADSVTANSERTPAGV